MTGSKVPAIIKVILFTQFLGVVLLGISTMLLDPLYLAITISGGSALIGLAFLIWVILLVREFLAFMRGLDTSKTHGT